MEVHVSQLTKYISTLLAGTGIEYLKQNYS